MEEKKNEIKDIKSKINYKNIKSSHIIKTIFLFLHKKQKLDIIINNKELQKVCLIDIEDYKNISGKYKIGKKNGKGKEYIINTNILILEGEYINRIKNRKRKKYD